MKPLLNGGKNMSEIREEQLAEYDEAQESLRKIDYD